MTIVSLILLAVFSVLAFWKQLAIIYMLLAGMSLMIGLEWYDVYAGELGMAISLVLMAYSLMCVGYAYRFILWSGGDE